MENKNDKKLNASSLRQLDVLERYYNIDHEKRLVKIPFHFKKVSDLINTNIKTKGIPVFKNDLLKEISYLMHKVPSEYRIDIDLEIEDYEGYSPEIISQSLIDCFETFHFDISIKNKSKAAAVSRLVFIGIIALILVSLLRSSVLTQVEDLSYFMRNTVLEILGTAVLWEAVYQILLPSDHFAKINYGILKSIHCLRLYGKENECVYEVYSEKIAKEWLTDVSTSMKQRNFILYAGTGMVSVSFVVLVTMIENLILSGGSDLALTLATYLSTAVIFFIAGSSGINYYHDKGFLRNSTVLMGILVTALSVGLTFFSIIELVIQYTNSQDFVLMSHLMPIAFSVVFLGLSIAFLVVAILLRKRKAVNLNLPKRVFRRRNRNKA